MAQRNVKLDDFELLKEDIHKKDLEILGLFSEQIEIFAGLIHAQNDVNRSYKEILFELEKRIHKLEVDFLNLKSKNLDP